jgi:hypothetical protein
VNLVLARREMILFRKKVIGEGAVNTSTIKNLHFNFLMFFIFNPMAEVARMINLLETILSLARPFILIRYYFFLSLAWASAHGCPINSFKRYMV